MGTVLDNGSQVPKVALNSVLKYKSKLEEALESHLVIWKEAKIVQYFKYLGMYQGRAPLAVPFEQPMAKFAQVVDFLRCLACGTESIARLFGMLATSVIAWPAFSLEPPASVVKAYQRGIQRALSLPWQSLPSQLVENMSVLGVRVQFRNLQSLSLAARARVAIATSTN